MDKHVKRLGVLPYLLLGLGLLIIGLLTMRHIVDNWWPFDVTRLDLVRAVGLNRADPAMLLEAANFEIIMAFLAAILVAFTGLAMPLAYLLNRRFLRSSTRPGKPEAPTFLVTVRQAMAVGFWVSFCVWLQMNRVLGIAVAGLVAVVLVMFELLLQVRTRAVDASELSG